jgi:hypothetical protein
MNKEHPQYGISAQTKNCGARETAIAKERLCKHACSAFSHVINKPRQNFIHL